jgi:hypothetical protein
MALQYDVPVWSDHWICTFRLCSHYFFCWSPLQDHLKVRYRFFPVISCVTVEQRRWLRGRWRWNRQFFARNNSFPFSPDVTWTAEYIQLGTALKRFTRAFWSKTTIFVLLSARSLDVSSYRYVATELQKQSICKIDARSIPIVLRDHSMSATRDRPTASAARVRYGTYFMNPQSHLQVHRYFVLIQYLNINFLFHMAEWHWTKVSLFYYPRQVISALITV